VTGRLARADVDVVAVEGDVELAEGDLRVGELGDAPPEPLGNRDAAGVDADEGDALELGIALDDLVCDPCQRALDRLGIENGLGLRGLRAQSALRVLLTFDSFPASRDRVKGVFFSPRESNGRAGRYPEATGRSKSTSSKRR
jgi:hypothetical protein